LRQGDYLRKYQRGLLVKMPVCGFCKKNYNLEKGITVVQKDGGIRHFCSSKCRKNSQMGRDNRKVGWVRKMKEKVVG